MGTRQHRTFDRLIDGSLFARHLTGGVDNFIAIVEDAIAHIQRLGRYSCTARFGANFARQLTIGQLATAAGLPVGTFRCGSIVGIRHFTASASPSASKVYEAERHEGKNALHYFDFYLLLGICLTVDLNELNTQCY